MIMRLTGYTIMVQRNQIISFSADSWMAYNHNNFLKMYFIPKI